MSIRALVISQLLCFFTPTLVGYGSGQEASFTIEHAWTAWRNGNVSDSQTLARSLPLSPERQHLLFLCAFVEGNYEKALLYYAEIDPSYSRYSELSRPVVEAYLHLSRYPEAESFAQKNQMEEGIVRRLMGRTKHPLKVTLTTLTEIPFAEHKLADYFPGFEAEIQGKKVIAHIDTGGTFIHMGLDRAEELGIELVESSEGKHGTRSVTTYFGIAKSFQIGDALFENIPVVVVPTLTGSQDFIIFGTKVLQQFLSTLDYPNKRLFLSPRKSPELRKKHLEMFRKNRVEIPFYMWGDHYMFVRGSVGEHRNLNFFVDSGLVSLHSDGKGGVKQAAFWALAEDSEKWGLSSDVVSEEVFESPLPLSIGPLKQSGLLFLAKEEQPVESLGGIRIHGLLSHAFLKKYTWTLDFDLQRYLFSR